MGETNQGAKQGPRTGRISPVGLWQPAKLVVRPEVRLVPAIPGNQLELECTTLVRAGALNHRDLAPCIRCPSPRGMRHLRGVANGVLSERKAYQAYAAS